MSRVVPEGLQFLDPMKEDFVTMYNDLVVPGKKIVSKKKKINLCSLTPIPRKYCICFKHTIFFDIELWANCQGHLNKNVNLFTYDFLYKHFCCKYY